MARVLAYTSPGRGHLFPVTSILLELAARGHEVHVRTLPGELELMRDLGFEASPIDPSIEQVELKDYSAKSSQGAVKAAAETFAARAEFEVPDLRSAIEQFRPDAVIVDFNCWGAMAAAERWGGPWAAFCPYPTMLRSPGIPPFGPGFAPAHGFGGRLRDRIAEPLVFGTVERAFLPGLNAVRKQAGAGEFDRVDDLVLSAPTLIYMTAEPFEYPRSDWPESFVMVGPCAWEPPASPPEWLDELEHPVVLITTSSEFQDDGRLIETAFEALEGEPVTAVATAPSVDTSRMKIPANARLERFIPHAPVLERSVCAVTHGGMGATQKALAHGVPVCAVPFGRDQLEVARRVEVSGAGTRLPPRRLSADRLRAKVREAIELRAGAERIADAFKAAGGAQAAADAVEQRLLLADGAAVQT